MTFLKSATSRSRAARSSFRESLRSDALSRASSRSRSRSTERTAAAPVAALSPFKTNSACSGNRRSSVARTIRKPDSSSTHRNRWTGATSRPGAGSAIDVCAAHGMWLDAGELGDVVRYATRRAEGGAALDEDAVAGPSPGLSPEAAAYIAVMKQKGSESIDRIEDMLVQSAQGHARVRHGDPRHEPRVGRAEAWPQREPAAGESRAPDSLRQFHRALQDRSLRARRLREPSAPGEPDRASGGERAPGDDDTLASLSTRSSAPTATMQGARHPIVGATVARVVRVHRARATATTLERAGYSRIARFPEYAQK